MPDEDRPPERIWLDDEALNEHWAAVERRREQQSRGVDPVPQGVNLEQNELTAGFKR